MTQAEIEKMAAFKIGDRVAYGEFDTTVDHPWRVKDIRLRDDGTVMYDIGSPNATVFGISEDLLRSP